MNKSYLWPSGSGGSSIRSGLICAINIYSLFSKSPTNLRMFDSTKPVLNINKPVHFRVGPFFGLTKFCRRRDHQQLPIEQ